MSKPKILSVLCHCDDEVIFGWPISQSDCFEKHLVIICNDMARRGPHRAGALREVCRQENISLHSCIGIDNNFYQLPTRHADYILTDAVASIEQTISKAISDIQPDYLFTHNPVGEYGHASHRLLWEIVSQHPQASAETKGVIFTDMCQTSNHRSHDVIPKSVRDAYYRTPLYMPGDFLTPESHKLDMDFYNRTKAIYDKTGSWTWDHPPMTEANLFIINELQYDN